MKIIDNLLFKKNEEPVDFVKSPNFEEGLKQEYLVIHYTAGRNAKESIRWLTNRASKASAHLVIGRDGNITQLVAFDKEAWHAGQSSWEDRVGLNGYSLGIELDNTGPMKRHGNRWLAWFGDEYDESEVIEAVHKHETESRGWQIFPAVQITAALNVGILLFKHFKLRDVVGHEDISPGRKTDPGPAFPMHSFRARLLGRRDEELKRYETTTNLNIRTGPGTQFPTIPGSPLPTGTPLEILRQEGAWALVDIIVEVNGIVDMQGWVHSRYLKPQE